MQIILIADDSDSMSDVYKGIKGKKSRDVTNGIRDWLIELKSKTRGLKPYFYFTLIIFGTDVDIIVENKLITRIKPETIDLHGESGATNLADALLVAARVLEENQLPSDTGVAYSEFCSPFVFIYTDGEVNSPEEAEKAARRLRAMSLPCGSPHIITLGFGEADQRFLERVASTREYYVDCEDSESLMRLLPKIGTPDPQRGGTEQDFVRGINATSARQREQREQREPGPRKNPRL